MLTPLRTDSHHARLGTYLVSQGPYAPPGARLRAIERGGAPCPLDLGQPANAPHHLDRLDVQPCRHTPEPRTNRPMADIDIEIPVRNVRLRTLRTAKT